MLSICLKGPRPLCLGRLTKVWGLGGLNKPHSILVEFLSNECCKISVLYWGECQISLLAGFPSVNCLYTIFKNTYVATTLIIDPILLTKFQPV